MKQIVYILALLVTLSLPSASAAKEGKKRKAVGASEESQPTTEETFDHGHTLFTKVLKAHVIVSGPKSALKYKSLKASPAQLELYLKSLSSVTRSEYDKFSKEQKLAFLINAYNAFTLKLIIKHYPVKSIKDIGGLFSSPWKKEFFKLWGKDMSLDKIEHNILRKKFNEPRIHFAVNCASIGCPALRAEAFTAHNLNEQLEEQAKIFMSDKSRNSYDTKKRRMKISKIFKWFSEDFEKNGSTVSKFAAKYFTEDESLRNEIANFKVSYSSYDWKLNESQ